LLYKCSTGADVTGQGSVGNEIVSGVRLQNRQ
jgi:hypothetical protein